MEHATYSLHNRINTLLVTNKTECFFDSVYVVW